MLEVNRDPGPVVSQLLPDMVVVLNLSLVASNEHDSDRYSIAQPIPYITPVFHFSFRQGTP